MAEPDNLVLQHWRAIREVLDTHTDRLLEITQRVGNLEVQVSNLAVQSRISRSGLTALTPASTASSVVSD